VIRRWPTSFALTVLIVTTVLISSIMNSMGVLAQRLRIMC